MYRDEFKNLPLSDRFMFGEVMRNPGICKLFLEELLQCKIERIVFAAKEVDLSDTVLGHGIRLDVFLADENNTHYDVEMQNTSDSIEKRSRYYQAVIDRELLKRSMDYDKLPESFIIFICNFDHVGKGLASVYDVARGMDGAGTCHCDLRAAGRPAAAGAAACGGVRRVHAAVCAQPHRLPVHV